MSSSYHDSYVVDLAAKILIISIVVLSVVVIFCFFTHLYVKWFREQDPTTPAPNTRRRHQEQQSGVTVLRRGLNPSFLKTIPVIPFDPKDFREGLECTVCLSELAHGEKTRILPKCCHGFHVECIDMWFHSHSTCPICRTPVSDHTHTQFSNLLEIQTSQTTTTTTNGVGIGVGDFPTNILFWGDESEVSTLTSQLEKANNHHQISPSSSQQTNNDRARTDLVIDIPTQIDVDDDIDIDDQKSPVSSRMRSLRRILSGSRRFINPFSPVNTNVEQRTRLHI